MQLFNQYLVIALGGALGSVLRFWIGTGIDSAVSKGGQIFPWGTIVVNITGCFIIGFFATVTSPEGRWLVPALARPFVLIGLLGGYTTFSSFSLQTLNLWSDNQRWEALGNVLISVVLCLVGVWTGAAVADWVNKLR
ncbi:MAG TPA: fluoride efflux transporter CrcB [Candidatus Methylacidiphilales bacterium]|jgi:CrcB protein|nr:fluoride efflux transporter CrcB [Candidatus Methylacidiphilales bacterium]